MVNCFWCGKYIEHPPIHHWIAYGILASVKCDGCRRQFEVWSRELQQLILNTNILKL